MKQKCMRTVLSIFCICLACSLAFSQEVIELRPPMKETANGVILKVDLARSTVLIKRTEPGAKENEQKIYFTEKTNMRYGSRKIEPTELSTGQQVIVKYKSEQRVPIIHNEVMPPVQVHTAKEIEVIQLVSSNTHEPAQASKGEGGFQDLQRRLVEFGYDPGPIDGIWGRKTEAALKDFQRQRGLTSSGKIDEETKSALGLRTCNQNLGGLLNDYLIIALYFLNDLNPEWKSLAWPIIEKYGLQDAKRFMKWGMSYSEISDGYEMLLLGQGQIAIKFGDDDMGSGGNS